VYYLSIERDHGEIEYDVIVLDSSGVPIYQHVRRFEKHAASLLAALIGIATEMELGSAVRIDFEEAVTYLVSGLRNRTLIVAVFSRTYDPKHLLSAIYLAEKIDERIKLIPGLITEKDTNIIAGIVTESLRKVCRVEDFITEFLTGIINELISPITLVGVMNIITATGKPLVEIFVNNPSLLKKQLAKWLGSIASQIIFERFFDKLKEKYGITNIDELKKEFIQSASEEKDRVIIRKLIRKVIDEMSK